MSDPASSGVSARILVVDDDPGMREAVAAVLGDAGYSVEAAASGREARACMAGPPCDAAVVDLRLPDVSGLDLLGELKSRWPDVEVVVITGHASLPTAVEAIHGGAFAYLEKPCSPDLLLATLERALERQALARALRESEERYRLVAENVNDAVLLLDPEGRVAFANRAAASLTGYAESELPGRAFASLLDPDDARESQAWMAAAPAGRAVPPLVEARIVRKDGQAVWAEANVTSIVRDGEVVGRLAVIRDVSEGKRAETALRHMVAEATRRRGEAEELARVARVLAESLDLDRVVERIVESVLAIFGADASVLWVLRSDGALVALGSAGTARAHYPRGSLAPRGSGTVGPVTREAQPIQTADIAADPRLTLTEEQRARIAATGVRAVLAAPLRVKGLVIGALSVSTRAARTFAEAEVGLLQAFADQAALALENARLFTEVRAGRERLAALSRRLVEVQEDERRHLARELHDEIGQVLTGLNLSLETAARLPADRAAARLGEARDLVKDLMAQVRQLSLDLRPAMLDDLGLLPALLWLVERYRSQTGVDVELQHAGLDRRFPPAVETAAYRIVQEALTNVARHGAIAKATLRLHTTEDTLVVQVEDRGVGFDPAAVLARAGTGGLAGMRERAILLGGQVSLESAPGAGTRVTAVLPLGAPVERRATERE